MKRHAVPSQLVHAHERGDDVEASLVHHEHLVHLDVVVVDAVERRTRRVQVQHADHRV